MLFRSAPCVPLRITCIPLVLTAVASCEEQHQATWAALFVKCRHILRHSCGRKKKPCYSHEVGTVGIHRGGSSTKAVKTLLRAMTSESHLTQEYCQRQPMRTRHILYSLQYHALNQWRPAEVVHFSLSRVVSNDFEYTYVV